MMMMVVVILVVIVMMTKVHLFIYSVADAHSPF